MFDDLIEKPRPRRWRTAVIVGSALVHAGVIAGVAIAAMWHVEKLDVASTMDITYRPPMPQGSSAPPPASKLAVQKRAVEKVKLKPPPVHQPAVVKDPDPVTRADTAATTTGQDTGGPGGDGNDPDADPASTGKCLTPGACDGVDADPPEPVVKKDEPKPPPIIEPKLARGLRISGNEQIHPPETVRIDMIHQGKSQLTATIQLCVDTSGRVDKLRMLRSSGFAEYDAKLLAEMRGWRYRPYLVNGQASGMCTVSVFLYRMTK